MTSRWRWAGAAVTVLALALAGCSPSEEELRREQLAAALDATFDGPLAFTLELDASDEALGAFGAQAGQLGGLLARSRAAGVLEEDRVALALTVAGVDLVQARLVATDEVYVRSDLAGVARAVGGPDGASLETALRSAMTDAGIGANAIAAVLAAIEGDWVRLLQDEPATEAGTAGETEVATVAEAVRALLEAGEITSHVGRLEGDDAFDGQFTLEVEPDAAAAAFIGALAGLDPTATLTDEASAPAPDAEPVRVVVVVTGGRLVTLEAGLASVLTAITGAERDEATTDVGLRLGLRGLAPEEPLITSPDAPTSITVAELTDALDAIGTVVPGLGG